MHSMAERFCRCHLGDVPHMSFLVHKILPWMVTTVFLFGCILFMPWTHNWSFIFSNGVLDGPTLCLWVRQKWMVELFLADAPLQSMTNSLTHPLDPNLRSPGHANCPLFNRERHGMQPCLSWRPTLTQSPACYNWCTPPPHHFRSMHCSLTGQYCNRCWPWPLMQATTNSTPVMTMAHGEPSKRWKVWITKGDADDHGCVAMQQLSFPVHSSWFSSDFPCGTQILHLKDYMARRIEWPASQQPNDVCLNWFWHACWCECHVDQHCDGKQTRLIQSAIKKEPLLGFSSGIIPLAMPKYSSKT